MFGVGRGSSVMFLLLALLYEWESGGKVPLNAPTSDTPKFNVKSKGHLGVDNKRSLAKFTFISLPTLPSKLLRIKRSIEVHIVT